MPPPSPIGANTDLCRVVVRVDGTAIPDTYAVSSVEVVSAVNRVPYATVEVSDGDAADSDFVISSTGVFTPGAKLSVSLGYHDSVSEVFSGIVTSQSIRRQANGSSLVVEAHHAVVKATLGRKNAVFLQTADADVVAQVLKASGASVSVSGSGPTLAQLVQYYVSDWDFAVSRAEANGWVVCALPDKVSVSVPGASGSPVLELQYGEDILDFDLQLDALHQVATVECKGWSYADQKVITASSQTSDLNAVGSYKSGALADAVGNTAWAFQSGAELAQAELAAWASAEYTRRAYAKLQGTLTFQGSKLVQPGSLVTLKGFGKVFDGDVFVAGVRQHLDHQGHWTSEISLGLDPSAFTSRVTVAAAPASGLVPGAQGLLNGVVKAITGDPSGNYRVQVQVPLLGDDGNSVWARLASIYASNSVGAVFYPEVGDEVILGFVNSDPSSAVILGSLYSGSKLVPPLPPDEKNSKKGIVTQKKMELVFDEAGPTISLKTPAGREIVLDDKGKLVTLQDNLGNSLKFSDSGIEIATSKKLTLSAGQGITASTSSGNVEITASAGTAKAHALQVQLTADQTFQASGSMTATLQSDLETVVKGLMVKIN